MSTRKTLSLPFELVQRIQAEAQREDRSFNNVVVHRLKQSFFGTQTVRQLVSLAASKASSGRKR